MYGSGGGEACILLKEKGGGKGASASCVQGEKKTIKVCLRSSGELSNAERERGERSPVLNLKATLERGEPAWNYAKERGAVDE